MKYHFSETGIAAGIGYAHDEKVLTGWDGGNMQAKLFGSRIENAIDGRYREPGAGIERPFGSAQRRGGVLRIESDIGGGAGARR